MGFPIEQYLGETFYIKIDEKWQLATLVDGEKEFNQPGLSCGFIHLADPTNPEKCLGYAGVTGLYDVLKENGDI